MTANGLIGINSKELRTHGRGKLILIIDRLPAHRAKTTIQFLKTQRDWLTIEWFPGYAPELNPVEYLWAALKRKDLGFPGDTS